MELLTFYGDMDKYDEAIASYLKATEFIKETDYRSRINIYRNISEIYLRKEDTLVSREYANKCLTTGKRI